MRRRAAIKALRWIAASLLGLVAGLLALVGLILCVTVLLAPLGIPLLLLARRLFRAAGDLVVPRKVRHPIEAIAEAGSGAVDDLAGTVRKRGRRLRRSARKARTRAKRRM